jgi:hypothetical protein
MLALGLDRAGGGIAGYFGLGPVPDRGHPPAHRRTPEFFFRKSGIPLRAANRIDFESIAGCRAGVNIGIVRSARKE